MAYGYFDNDKREYVITNPKTPVTWINYIGDLKFGGFVDQTGGSLLCKGDPALNRIVKYLPQLPASEFKGETLYLRLKTKNAIEVLSPYYVPTLTPYDLYECHVGLGYTRYLTEMKGIRIECLVFVPIGEHREIREIKITNRTNEIVEIDVIPVVEYTHFDALKQFTNADWVPQTMQSKIIQEEGNNKILTQYAFMHQEDRINFFTSNWPITSFESDRRRFLGDNGYGTWQHPLSLKEEELSNYEALRGDNIGALMHHLGVFEPHETKKIITQLGQCANIEDEKKLIQIYRQEDKVREAYKALQEFWEKYLTRFVVKTPDEAMNTMLNIHNPRQCFTTKQWSRYLSLYQLGLGSRGIGVRDSAQDSLGVMAHMPEETLGLIRQLLSVQKRDGASMHQLNPLTMEANEGDAREMEDRPNYYSDDHLWVILAVCAYLKETGDYSFLEEEIPFYEKDKKEQPIEKATVLEHLKRGLAFTNTHLGDHGWPLLGFADWNDTVNLETGAESIFTANLYGYALLEMIELCHVLGVSEEEKKYKQAYAQMKEAVNEYGWDGEWFIRYYDAKGTPLGSKYNEHGQIYVNAQSWSILSGFALPEYGQQALDSVHSILNTQHGIKLSYPGFNKYDRRKGGITSYPPGAKENGGIFLHSNPWVVIAETKLGHGDRAYEYYNQLNPVTKNDKIDSYECEPYCYPQNILGDEHPQFGLARNSWLSGTASWMYQSAVQYILGIRAHYEGLIVDPCIPKAWEGFYVTRHFRNALYEIRVNNPEHVSRGIKTLIVDGEKCTKIPIFSDGKIHKVQVVMGESTKGDA